MWYFGRMSIIAPVANLVAGPVITILQPALFLALIFSPIPAVAKFIAAAAHPLMRVFDGIAATAAGIVAPYAGFTGSVAQALRPFPQYQNITLNANPIGNNTYNAFQVRAQKRFSNGLTFLISFNYAKNLTDAHGQSSGGYLGGAQNYYNVSLEKAVEANDVPHALAAAYTYQLPFGTGKNLRTGSRFIDKYVISGWTTSGVWTVQDGKPLALTTQLSLPAAGAVRPNMVSGNVYGAHDRSSFDPAKDLYVNRAAFALPASFTFGNAPRLISQLRAFGIVSWNVALLKSIPIRENLRLILRPEFFNVLNNVNFSAPNQDFSNLAFGRITAAGFCTPLTVSVSVSQSSVDNSVGFASQRTATAVPAAL